MSDSSEESSDEENGQHFIVPIAQKELRRIVAGQAVSDIASAVKELVDNSLDAEARSVNIRLFNQGLDVIEVSDDGRGVPTHSRPLMAMKHATSKIRSFEEIYEDVIPVDEIQPMKQLGFRGEALFCMANVSQNLVVSTRTEKDEIGQKLEFRRDGYLNPNNATNIPRKVGTTVAVVKLFDALPVRRADLIKRIKSQRAKLLRLIQGYAIMKVGVRFNVIDITGPVGSPKCKTEVKLSTSEKSKSIKDTVSSVLGSKFLAGMCPVTVDLSSVVSQARAKMGVVNDVSSNHVWRIEGLVSKSPNANEGTAIARELQFFSVNGRPVELPKISRIIGDAWRTFDSMSSNGSRESFKKRPACVIGLYLPNSMYDVNLAPDKREVLLTEESTICQLLQGALHDLWSTQSEGKFEVNEVESVSNKKRSVIGVDTTAGAEENECTIQSEDNLDKKESRRSFTGKMRRRNAFVNSFDNIRNINTDADNQIKSSSTQTLSEDLSKSSQPEKLLTEDNLTSIQKQNINKDLSINGKNVNSWEQTKLKFNAAGIIRQREEIQQLLYGMSKKRSFDSTADTMIRGKKRQFSSSIRNGDEDDKGADSHTTGPSKDTLTSPNSECNFECRKVSAEKTSISPTEIKAQQSLVPSPEGMTPILLTKESPLHNTDDHSKASIIPTTACKESMPKVTPHSSDISGEETDLKLISVVSKRYNRNKIRREDEILTGEESSETKYIASHENNLSKSTISSTPLSDDIIWEDFRGTGTVIKDAQVARINMTRTRRNLRKSSTATSSKGKLGNLDSEFFKRDKKVGLSKEDFTTMTIIGQFNLGFILARCQNHHLWILDQHACDEKFNFERLCTNTVMHEQKLIAPLPLELSPSEENCVLENMELFELNGFRFHYDGEKPPRHRLSLTALPHSGSGGDGRKAVQFGKEDVGAMCAILGANGASSSTGFIAGSGTGADGGGSMGNNAVRRYAGGGGAGAVIRLPKAIAMFASRACRGSIMIGEALSQSKMELIVKRLRDVDQPWNCPHGRPTMRHVKELLEDLLHDA